MKLKTKHSDLASHTEGDSRCLYCKPTGNHQKGMMPAVKSFGTLDIDNVYDSEEFQEGFDIHISTMTRDALEFEIVGIDPAVANSLRRLMISEIPTMAIEHVFIVDNTSAVHDELLAHRLGLVPILADPTKFDFVTTNSYSCEKNTIVFRLAVSCDFTCGIIENEEVRSSDLEWLPDGSEMPEETFCYFSTGQQSIKPLIRPVHDGIPLAMLSLGQQILLEAHCIKGTGKEHAKWSPVATVWYRLLPEVVILKEVNGDLAEQLVDELPGLFSLEKVGPSSRLRVGDPKKHELLLEKVRCLSDENKWAPFLQLRKIKDHFIYTIETTGILKAWDIFNEAIELLQIKVEKILRLL